MFSQKKRNHGWLYVTIALAVIIAAVFLLIGALSSRNAGQADQDRLENRAEQQESGQAGGSTQGAQDSAEASVPMPQPGTTDEKDEGEPFYQSYYLVKLDKDVIKIFFSDETGKLTELEETGIIYETLSADDQKRFTDGIKLEKRDDLNKLMMDYES